jgi:hypothetical protein
MNVFGPTPVSTGNIAQQPSVANTQNAWYFDARGNYQGHFTGALDAPELVPTGATIKSREWKHQGDDYLLLSGHVLRGGAL